jgi:hypothetical protein
MAPLGFDFLFALATVLVRAAFFLFFPRPLQNHWNIGTML